MGFFHSPIKLFKLFAEKNSIQQELNEGRKRREAEWYFTKEGEEAYNNAKTAAQKTMYFFDYLSAVHKIHLSKIFYDQNIDLFKDNIEITKEVLYKMAYVMAHSMDNSSLKFSGYPNILDPEKNPIVNRFKSEIPFYEHKAAYAPLFLAALNNEENTDLFFNIELQPYSRLTYCKPNGDIDDMYKIERDIISAFCADYEGKYMPPYLYHILKPTTDTK